MVTNMATIELRNAVDLVLNVKEVSGGEAPNA